KFRENNVPVIIGGVHPSLIKTEFSFADSILVGEAELIWQDILKDCEHKKLKKIYHGKTIDDLDKIPLPRRDLFKKKYFHEPVQITRGCNMTCDFCYLQYMPWKKFRKRSIKSIIEELRGIKNRFIFIVDDNLFCDFKYAKELFRAMIPLNKIWWIQAPTTIAKDKELLSLMQRSGCYSVSLGFQTVDDGSLKDASISQNKIENYKTIVRTVHRYKMFVNGFFIFGFDSDKKDIFARTFRVIKDIDVDDAFLYVLTPFPGTKLFDRLEKERRLLTYDYSKYTWNNCVFQPTHMTPDELVAGVRELYPKVIKHFRQRLIKNCLSNFGLLMKSPILAYMLLAGSFRNVDTRRLP
ncbi:MAG: radical SAM protein, partial [archaeon]